jgi:hypothetical protein
MANKNLIITAFTVVLSFGISRAQQPVQPAELESYFKELAEETKTHQQLWGLDLYGPVLLIDIQSARVFANMPDSAGVLKPENGLYSGTLTDPQLGANTAMKWNGTHWATVILPLPKNKYDRIGLMAHELFHVSQSALGFIALNDACNHLDDKNGRIYLRLELEALKQALLATSDKDINAHLNVAFMFREYRRSLYPGSDTLENNLELNEGIAEFTGEMICGRPDTEKPVHFIRNIEYFLDNPTFVRSFAYHTIPAYGYLLSKKSNDWNRKINSDTDLTALFINEFKLNPESSQTATLSEMYGGKIIIAEETEREDSINVLKARYKTLFVEQPHLEIRNEQMQIQFDPRNIMPLDDKGSVYPNLRVSDKWGTLTVTEGALISPRWDVVFVSFPGEFEDKKVSGQGWTLELADGYAVIHDQQSGNYLLTKVPD